MTATEKLQQRIILSAFLFFFLVAFKCHAPMATRPMCASVSVSVRYLIAQTTVHGCVFVCVAHVRNAFSVAFCPALTHFAQQKLSHKIYEKN